METTNRSYGKYWAAVSGDFVIGLTLMPWINREDPRFAAYREKAKENLSLLGEVITGDIQEINGIRVFVKRLTHANRPQASPLPRVPRVYQLPPNLR